MKKIISLSAFGLFLFPVLTRAYYTNQNFLTLPHEVPAWFLADGWGGFYGETVNGTIFTQRSVANDFNIKLQKFSIDAAYFYVSDRGVINAKDDLMALSIYFTLT